MVEIILKQYALWEKTLKNHDKLVEYKDASMMTLSFFLGDGLRFKIYLEFLKDSSENNLTGNIIRLHKTTDQSVILTMDDYVFPGMVPFKTSVQNMITIIEKNEKLNFRF